MTTSDKTQRIQRAAAEVAYWIDQIAKASGYTTRRQLDSFVRQAAAATLRLLEETAEGSGGGADVQA